MVVESNTEDVTSKSSNEDDKTVETPITDTTSAADSTSKDSFASADSIRLSHDESQKSESESDHVVDVDVPVASTNGDLKPDPPVEAEPEESEATPVADPDDSTPRPQTAGPSIDTTILDTKQSSQHLVAPIPDTPSPSSQSPAIVEKPPLVQRNTSENLKTKMSNSLSWFSRATNMRRASGSPTSNGLPLPPGRNSDASPSGHTRDASTASATPRHSESLQDRFMLLRMQQEGSATTIATANEPNGDAVFTNTIVTSPQSPEAEHPTSPTLSRSESAKLLSTRDTKLPPGTAAGVSVGPATEDEGPVNWDLWQTVVQEGPAAVARSSGEQLTRAIKNGIPQPIRGVVWQVLAQSKSEDLESVYNELVNRTTDQPIHMKSPSMSRQESNNFAPGATPIEKESIASSATSIHSETSTPATNNVAVSPLPSAISSISDTISSVSNALVIEKRRRGSVNNANLQKLEKTIRRDLGARTSYSKYVASAGMQEPLFRVCKAYALYDEPIGYAQGMNFITMPLLFNMPEEEAFTLLVRLMSNYNMRSMFSAEMTGLHLRLYQFERLLEDFEPALYCHLHRREVSPNLYATQWFLTLFAYRFPLQLVLRIYDLVLSEGLSAILKFGVVLMQKNAQTLLDMKDMSQLTTFLKEKIFDVYIDKSPSANSILESGFFGSTGGIDKDVYHADALIRDACAIQLNADTLARYEAEFEEKSRVERERLTELDTLRSTNSTLTAKVRTLEKTAQQLDQEHVSIASDLVKTKVENESLKDSNETLRTKVDELQKLLDSQPAEVEAKLKDEMERIMARNIEVQNSNRELEEANTDMEQQLVAAKLDNAQLNSDRDSLKQKIYSIQSMLGETKI